MPTSNAKVESLMVVVQDLAQDADLVLVLVAGLEETLAPSREAA